MARTVRTARQDGLLSLLNTDGRAHPLQNGLAGAAVLLGLAALVCGFFPGLHLVASWTGLLGLAAGLWGQMISETTAERFLLVVGLGAAGIGFYLGMARGGLFGGLIG